MADLTVKIPNDAAMQDDTIFIKINKRDKERIKAKAQSYHMTLSRYVREVLLAQLEGDSHGISQ